MLQFYYSTSSENGVVVDIVFATTFYTEIGNFVKFLETLKFYKKKKSPIQQQYSVYTILNHKINLNEEHSADFWDYQNWQDFKSSSFKEIHGSKWCKYVV